jgi:hypothetical protein
LLVRKKTNPRGMRPQGRIARVLSDIVKRRSFRANAGTRIMLIVAIGVPRTLQMSIASAIFCASRNLKRERHQSMTLDRSSSDRS